jgi:hypothetical protein
MKQGSQKHQSMILGKLINRTEDSTMANQKETRTPEKKRKEKKRKEKVCCQSKALFIPITDARQFAQMEL